MFLLQRFTPTTAMFDMRDVILFIDKLTDVFKIIALIGTQMLFLGRERNHD